MRDLAELYKALADETRLQMLVLLLERDELCVCDFVGALDITQSKASRHLRYLYHSGLLEDRRDGVWIRYRIASQLSPVAQGLLDGLLTTVGPPAKTDLLQRLDQWLQQKPEGGPEVCSC